MALIRQWVDEMLTAYGVFYYEGFELCLISSPLLRLTGGKGIKLRRIFLQPRKYGKRTSSASQSPMSRVGDGAAFSACNSPRADLPAVTTFGEGTACGADRTLARSARRAEN